MTPRLLTGAVALIVFCAAICGGAYYVRRLEERHVHALAPQMFAQKNQGAGLQRTAFRQSDLLPLYGSSDLNTPNPYHASALFRDYPTGFTVFPIGAPGSTSLLWLQAIAAVGRDLRGKKVALSISGRQFMADMVDPHSYAANFSRLHANETAFSTALSFAVKQDAARRLLQYPKTVASDPLLGFALEQLADGSLRGRVLYYASLPLGKLQTIILRLRDDWKTFAFLRSQHGLGSVHKRPADLEWEPILARAERESRRTSDNNPYGFDNAFWATNAADISMQRGLYARQPLDETMRQSAEWTDLDILLRAVRELGAEPLILNVPMNGSYYEHLGMSSATRRAYYDQLHPFATARGANTIGFAEHDGDKDFTVDPSPHLSAKGWAHYGRALSSFFADGERDDL